MGNWTFNMEDDFTTPDGNWKNWNFDTSTDANLNWKQLHDEFAMECRDYSFYPVQNYCNFNIQDWSMIKSRRN